MPPRRRAPGVVAAVRRDLRKLPEELRDCAEAAVALNLARTIDQGLTVAQCSKELRALLVALRSRAGGDGLEQAKRRAVAAPAPVEQPKESRVGDLASRIAARRGAAAG